MRIHHWVLLVSVVASTGCQAPRSSSYIQQSLMPSQKIALESSVRSFVATVAHDVTQEGPAAWSKFFLDSPSFFMASEGHLQFANGQEAAATIQNLTRIIKHIDLRWGDDLRVDLLTPNLAAVGASYAEVRLDAEGHQVNEAGYFTGVTELVNGRWRFRNAHWSVVVPSTKVP